MFSSLQYGVTGRAIKRGLVNIDYWNPRDYATDNYGTVDDTPYGGGPGMVMKVEPLQAAVKLAKKALPKAKVVYLSPQGKRLDQQHIITLAKAEEMIVIAGRYEGVDERLITCCVDEQCSIGDYVLSGGELAAMVMVDAMVRSLPGALGNAASVGAESFTSGLLDYPTYTRPEAINGLQVPKVLLSGDHQAIAKWRLKQALGATWLKRPDLLKNKQLTEQEELLLAEFIRDYKKERDND